MSVSSTFNQTIAIDAVKIPSPGSMVRTGGLVTLPDYGTVARRHSRDWGAARPSREETIMPRYTGGGVSDALVSADRAEPPGEM
jgi:hypothetical protein